MSLNPACTLESPGDLISLRVGQWGILSLFLLLIFLHIPGKCNVQSGLRTLHLYTIKYQVKNRPQSKPQVLEYLDLAGFVYIQPESETTSGS